VHGDGRVGADAVCERTYCASNAARSRAAVFELSATENSQQQRKKAA
jgi:hypothetical protein